MALEIRRDRHALSSRSLAGERNLRLILQFLAALSLLGSVITGLARGVGRSEREA